MNDRVIIKERARRQLQAFRGPCIAVYVLFYVLGSLITAVSFGLGAILLQPPLLIGMTIFYLAAWRGSDPQVEQLFSGFQQFLQSLIAILWMYLWTFLWSLLFVIPGIIKLFSYSMTPYLVAEYPDLEPRAALKISMAITKGRKAEICVMYMSFLGWTFLSSFTFGILYVVFVGPYMQLSFAGLYESLLADALEEGIVTLSDLHG